MTETYLRVPIVEAVEWGEWLEEELTAAAQKADVEMLEPDGEEEGEWFVFMFGAEPQAVEKVARDALKPKKAQVAVTGDDQVTVTVPTSLVWIRILGPSEHAYDKAVKDLAKEFSDTYSSWWAKTGRSRLLVQQSENDGRHPWMFENDGDDLFVIARVDLSIIDRKASKVEAEEAARANLRAVIDQVGEHLGIEPATS